MPLGRQFRNTSWTEEDGSTKYALDNGAQKPLITDSSNVPTQGLLFSPYTGTGLREDPLVTDRSARIHHALHLEDVDLYRTRLGSMIPSQRVKTRRLDEHGQPLQTERRSSEYTVTSKRGERGALADIALIHDALDHTDMPSHRISRVNAPTVLDPSSGRAYAEDYSNRIRLTTDRRKERVVVPGVTTTRVVGDIGAPIINKSFHNQVSRIDWGSQEGAHADMSGQGHFVHAQTGEPLDMSHPDNDFRAAHVAGNIWPGAGKDSDKYVTKTFQVWNGVDNRGNDRIRTFHTRHALIPTGTETVTAPDTMKSETILSTNPRTLTHEIGHTLDPNVTDRYSHRRVRGHKADPVEEGIADAYADRYVRHAGMFEETLQPSKHRMMTIEVTGYGTRYHHWNKDPVAKALYVATRLHSAMSDRGHEDIPSRDALAKQYGIGQAYEHYGHNESKESIDRSKKVNTLLLGHLYDTHAHVREGLHQMGMSGVGVRAQQEYLKASNPSHGLYEQGELFEANDADLEHLFGPAKGKRR